MVPVHGHIKRVTILGVGLSPSSMEHAVARIDDWIARREQTYVCLAAVHSIMACRRDPSLRRIFNASGLTTPDGMPLVWLTRLMSHQRVERVYGPDLMLAVCAHGIDRGYRHLFYGGEPSVPEELAKRLLARFDGLQVAGTVAPPFGEPSEAERLSLNERINDSNATIVWAGLGTGRQEMWMARNRAGLKAPVLISVGAAFDFLSGRKPQAPVWIQHSGLEWLFRLATEPRRLWPRYREYPLFLVLLAGQLLGLTQPTAEEQTKSRR